jgi:Zn-dependent M28 family amino/carboxypeptidase
VPTSSRLIPFAFAFVLAACGRDADRAAFVDSAGSAEAVATAAQRIDSAGLHVRIADLAADSMEGRAPGTPGEEKTVAYLTRQFQALGLEPGNPDGSFVQNVDLIGYESRPSATIIAGGRRIPMRFPRDYVASSRHDRPRTSVDNSEVVFVGYGVVAPEYGWDDYKGVDVSGKTIVMLINDPAVASSGDTTQLDTAVFKGNAMTYYGRWTYKYEIASEKRAAAALIVHETGPAGYPYSVVEGSFSREQFDVPSANAGQRVPVEGWLSLEKTKEMFRAAGYDFDSLKAAARRTDFRPVTLNARASFAVDVGVRRIQSKNVVAKLPGSGTPDEYVVYTAHWDHLGRDSTLTGDQIFNGALDNASGTASLLEIAEAFTALETAPKRSILFLAVTAEEKGLLGAKYYATNPLYPLDRTVGNLNMDGVNQWGSTSDVTVIGYGNSTLDDVLARVAGTVNRSVRSDPEPEKGFYYRSDHFEFAKQGVPALYMDSGTEYIGKPGDYGMKKREEYTNVDYHAVTDEIKPDWDLSGAVDDARMLFRIGYIVAQSPQIPEWKPGTEFKALRDSMMGVREEAGN